MCFICKGTTALHRKANVEIHFVTIHKNYEGDYPGGTVVRKTKAQQLKAHQSTQHNSFFKYNTNSKTPTITSLQVAET